jgi:hypothetical protein
LGNCTGATSDRQVLILVAILELLQDWTMWAVVAPAGFDENRQRVDHVLKTFDLAFQFLDMTFCQALDLGALSGFVAPQFEKFVDLVDREAEIARSADEAEHMHIGGGVITIT